jgi:hypothetical protein
MAKKTKASVSKTAATGPAETPRMLEHYLNTVRPTLGSALSRTNPHAIPKLVKIVVNMGVGVAVTEKKYLEEAIGAMAQVTGQKRLRLQAAGKSADRMQGHPAGPADVRIPRSPGVARVAPGA